MSDFQREISPSWVHGEPSRFHTCVPGADACSELGERHINHRLSRDEDMLVQFGMSMWAGMGQIAR